VGLTASEPVSATGIPFNVALTAFFVVQVMTDDPPCTIAVGLALTPAATAPVAAALTVTVAEPQSVVPVELVAATLYRVVTVGCTVIDPLSGTGAPFNVALTAFFVVQVMMDD